MIISYRQSDESQIDVALTLLKEAALNLKKRNIRHWWYWIDPPQEKVEWLKQGFDNQEFYFVYSGTERIGMFRLLQEDIYFWGPQEEDARYIHSFVILPAYLGQGLGKQVLEKVCHEMKASDVFILRLDCDASNNGLCDYYENQGFKKVGKKITAFSTNNLYEKRI